MSFESFIARRYLWSGRVFISVSTWITTLGVTLGVDVGKFDVLVVCRWADGRFERPWRIKNPREIATLVALVRQVKADRELVVAMESSGTYGDALRQALGDNGIEVQRVNGKAAHDYAEVFDGVPSQHDGKDAAVIAELAALGKCQPWAYQPVSAWEQELSYWVEWMVTHRQILAAVWGPAHGEDTQYLRVFIGQLRAKIERDPTTPTIVKTEPGVGYRAAEP